MQAVFNIIQQNNKHCRVCGRSLWASFCGLDMICEDCKFREDERERPKPSEKK